MALEYFLYRTDFSNTLVDRSITTFAPLSGNTGQIFIDAAIPEIQPLYLYKEVTGTIVINDDATIQSWLNFSNPPEDYDKVFQIQYTGYTSANNIRVTNVETAIISVDNDVTYVSGITSGNTVNITTNADNILDNSSDITYVSGQTDTKLPIDDFSVYSGDTANNINFISGQTSGNTQAILDQQLEFTGYTANTATKRILVVNNTIQDMNTLLGVRIQWDITNRIDTDYFSHTVGTTTITILQTGKYVVGMSIPMIYAGGGNQVNNVGLSVVVDGVQDTDTFISATVNKDRQQTAALANVEHDFIAGEVVEVEGYTLGGATSANTVAGSPWFQITKVNN